MEPIEDRLAELAPFTRIVGVERAGQVAADDIAQEALIAAWGVLQGRPDAPRPYLIGTVKRRAANTARGGRLTGAASRQGRADTHARAGSPDVADDAPAVELDHVTSEAVRAAVRGLPREEDRRAVWLVFWQGYTQAQAADELGIGLSAFEHRWSGRIAPALRLLLEEVR